MSYTQAHSYNAVLANRNAVFDDAAATYETASTNMHITVQYGAGRDMTMIFDRRVMFDQCAAIDNTIFTDARTGVYDCAMHHDRASTDACVTRNVGGRRNNIRQFKSV